MDDELIELHLSRIETRWSQLRQAHEETGEQKRASQSDLLDRYHRAASRYLLAITRDADLAEELFQEFAVRFLRGDFRGADPGKGQFRVYLKTSLVRLVTDFHRRKNRNRPHERNVDSGPDAREIIEETEPDRKFEEEWRNELIHRAWIQLKKISDESSQPYFEVLQIRSQSPELGSQELADSLNKVLGSTASYNAVSVRKLLQRARERFAEALLDDVARSTGSNSRDLLEDELIASGLMEYCKPALDRRR